MDASTVQLQRGEDAVECWDDDDDLQCIDDVQFCATSTASSVANSSVRRSGHRDSISSRRSARSELDSITGTDDDWQIMINGDDEFATDEVVSSARNAGVHIPENVPKSALTGGTIKRLGRKKTTDFVNDWTEDVVFPSSDKKLELQNFQQRSFPDSFPDSLPPITPSREENPVKTPPPSFWDDYDDTSDARPPKPIDTLDKFREEANGSPVQDVPTIKVAKYGSPPKAPPHPASHDADDDFESFDKDLELPTDGFPLQLSSTKEIPENQSPRVEDLEMDYSEGSIGVRFGGTARERRSDPSSSISIVSPSASSCVTGESEDDGLDGLVIPEGPLDLETSMKKRQDSEHTPLERPSEHTGEVEWSAEGDDFFSGLEIGDGDVGGPVKLTVNPNVKCKTEHHRSGPSHRSSSSITFMDAKSRTHRLSGHERSLGTHLETVSESGAPISNFHRPDSRIGSPTTTPSSAQQARRLAGGGDMAMDEPTPSGPQALNPRRSIPLLRNANRITSMSSSPRRLPASRSFSSARPKTPVDRSGNDTGLVQRRQPTTLTPTGASRNQPHHMNVKTYHSRRTNSNGSVETFGAQDALPKTSRFGRGGPLGNNAGGTDGGLSTVTKRSLTKPTRRRNFGDGSELELFDDLPTSSAAEGKFVKNPAGRGVPRSFRSKLNRSQGASSRMDVPPQPATPGTTSKPQGLTPRFARDTTASRNAREQRIAAMTPGSRTRESGPLTPLSTNWKSQPSRIPLSSAAARHKSTNKPQLIKPTGTGVNEAKGMCLLICEIRI